MLAGGDILQQAPDVLLRQAAQLLQAGAQLFEQVQAFALQALAAAAVQWCAAPGQLIGDQAGASPVIALFALAQMCQGQHVAPAALQQLVNQAWQRPADQYPTDLLAGLLPGRLQAVVAARGIQGAPLA
ncbi:hypothetical protein D3C78_1294520 [compost metagenome]